MIRRGRHMIFPNAYNRDQFTPEQEARMDEQQARSEGPPVEECDHDEVVPFDGVYCTRCGIADEGREPTDDDLYNGPGVEGGIPYSTPHNAP